MIYSNQMQTQVNWKIIFVSLVLFSGLVSVLLFTGRKQILRTKASGSVALRMTPAEKRVTQGDTFDISILIDTGEDSVSAVELFIAYDPAKLQIIELNASDMFPVMLLNPVLDNGSYHIALGSPPSSPLKGTGIVTTLSFRAINDGETLLALTDPSMVAAVGKNDNVLSQTYPARITIRSSMDPTETPIPTPTWSMTPTPTLLPKPSPWPSSSPLPTPTSTRKPKPLDTPYIEMTLPRESAPIRVAEPTRWNDRPPPTSPFPSWLEAIFEAIADVVCRLAACT